MTNQAKTYEELNSADWWGIATMFRCPHDTDPENSDIALVGVPHSSSLCLTYRDQHLGPRAVRDVSVGYRRIHKQFQLSPWEACRINDLGDVPLPRAMDGEKSLKDIEAFYKSLDAAGTRPVSIGGDHSITLPILRAIAGPDSNISKGPIAVVHFDAHTDGYVGEYFGATEWAGSWSRIMNEEGLVNPDKVFQIGIRGNPEYLGEDDPSLEAGYRVIEMEEFDEIGVDAVVKEIREKIGDTPVYITLDLDALDPSIAPGTTLPEPGSTGLIMREVKGILQGMRGMNVIGGDVACLMPTKDSPNKITSWNAMAILFEQICLIADYLDKRE